ncbi:hypothetical protein KBB96_14775 [Luteolibacter ambystomatis]|uniref:Uncharacterized protein n=1 Tax=Luteolibacter ambystomatis TaxID=2824561 RepID=A0A975G6A7_9BACT|nr:hypothetical protein [Luteolibacter ambystomatis]QUE50127.1 hypothetical protein KBB96_14775 [Luteolibacter ambystomatis]
MSVSNSKGLLTGATSQLQAQWLEVRASWRDRKAQEFEQDYLSDLESSVRATVKVIEDIERLLQQVHADCE